MKSWRNFGDYTIVYGNKLDAIQCQHGSDEACLKAVVESFLLEDGHYQPSWRRVIHALHEASESHLANQIKSYAEPVQGECVWVMSTCVCVGTCALVWICFC